MLTRLTFPGRSCSRFRIHVIKLEATAVKTKHATAKGITRRWFTCRATAAEDTVTGGTKAGRFRVSWISMIASPMC